MVQSYDGGHRTRRVRRALERLGCAQVRKASGHTVYESPSGRRQPLPLSHPTISRAMVKDVCRRLEISYDELRQHL